jgi:tellurite methyltransferase
MPGKIAEWNERYARGEHGGQQPIDIIETIARGYAPGRALDLACGVGRHALLLARYGWSVTAVDASAVAIARLRDSAAAAGLKMQAIVQDLEASDFVIEAGTYDLICDCCYLQRTLIPRIRSGVRAGGLAAVALAMVDDRPEVKPMNPAFLVQDGEVRKWFEDWEIIHYKEESESGGRRKTARMIARRPELAKSNE